MRYLNKFRPKLLPSLFLVASLFCSSAFSADVKKSVVKIYSVSQSWLFDRPWKKSSVRTGIGTGFIIKGGRILTNAHVVSNARYIEVQKYYSSRKYIAKVAFISHCSDLAILKIDDKSFYDDMIPLEFSPLPELNSEVTTYGYPVGGRQISVTRGVVSRIEMHTYSHSGVDQHLTIQTDAAINPGNSGGPVLLDGKVIGVAFQGLTKADNVGYMIPSIVAKQFLEDVADGKVDEFSDLAINYQKYCQNPVFRKMIGLPPNLSGVVVTRLFPNMPAYLKLKRMDVITSINGNKVGDDGFVILDGRKMNFLEVVERIQVGGVIPLKVWRDGAEKSLKIDAVVWKTPISFRNPFGLTPKYLIFGGLAFTPFSKGYISASGGWKKLSFALKMLYVGANSDDKYSTFKEFPILSKRLPDGVNLNMGSFERAVVESVNGTVIHSMKELKKALLDSKKDLIEMKFMGMDMPLVISKRDALGRSAEILRKYHISKGERL